MKTINLITNTNIKKMMFPDSQPHIVLENIQAGDKIRVVAPIRSSLELVQLMMTVNALAHVGVDNSQLVIPYLMAARYDRLMQPGDSFDLEVIADIINNFHFAEVHLFDVHSSIATKLIRRSKSHDNRKLVKTYEQPNAVLIVPDKGAVEKAKEYTTWNPNIVDVVYCTKHRDPITGKIISLDVDEPEKCKGRNCIIIDDICDGGGTFLGIAEQIEPKHLTLMVSHGIFSKGFAVLKKKFHDIITTDSYFDWNTNDVTVYELNL